MSKTYHQQRNLDNITGQYHWTISLDNITVMFAQDLPIRIRIVETCKIKTFREFAVQWGTQQIKIQLRYFTGILRMLWGNSKTLKLHQLTIFYQSTIWNCQISSCSEKFYPQFYKVLYLQKIFTKISVVIVVFSLVLKLKITY